MIENERLGINFHEFFIYDEDSPTGLCHRYDRRNVKAGSVAGSLTNTYSKVRLDYTMYATHRVIWQMHYGTIQSDMEIDHDYITAKILAIKFRETQIAILNSKGFGYTERHGL